MRALRSRVIAAAAFAAAFASAPAGASELGFYVGFLYGDRSQELDIATFGGWATQVYADFGHVPELRRYTSEDDGKAYGFLAGYRLTRHLAFEGAYMFLGKQRYREQANGFFFPPEGDPQAEVWDLSLTSETSGFALSAVGILPISYSWELYARAGVLIGSNSLSLWANSANDPGSPHGMTINESSTDWLAGAGISVSLAEVYSLRAEFTRIFDAGAEAFGEADADVITIGITVAF